MYKLSLQCVLMGTESRTRRVALDIKDQVVREGPARTLWCWRKSLIMVHSEQIINLSKRSARFAVLKLFKMVEKNIKEESVVRS